ncbi:MAG TPA: GAF domain-containing protein [Actinomycetales bacterium]|nr:GAF domain-containing protein [Actinomycetales bacterium]
MRLHDPRLDALRGRGPAAPRPVPRRPARLRGAGVRFYAGQPLRTRTGTPVGALCLLDTKRREITDAELSTLRDLADHVEAELARTDELDRAVEVRRNLLTRSVPELPGYELDARCAPAAAVGGDFYDSGARRGSTPSTPRSTESPTTSRATSRTPRRS